MRLLTLIACAGAAMIGPLPVVAGVLGSAAVPDYALQEIRGGFSDSSGQLVVSFGIQRAVYANGQLAADTGYRSGGLQPNASAATGSAATLLVQQGAANSVVSVNPGNAAAATFVQNSLNNQKIQTLTTIDVTTNSLQAYKSANLQSVVGAGIAASLRR